MNENDELPDGLDYIRVAGMAGEDVVLVGEILAGGAAWGAHGKRLQSKMRVTTVTPLVTAYAGMGLRPPEPWGVAIEADTLLARLDTLGVERFHLGGWSLGGAIALHLAMSHPHRVRSLALVEPVAWWLVRRLGLEVAGYNLSIANYQDIAAAEPNEATVARFLVAVGAVPLGENPRLMRGWQLAVNNRFAIPYAWRVLHHNDDPARLTNLTMPLLLVRGDASQPSDIAITGALTSLVPQAETLVLPGGHTSHITNLNRFMEHYEAFLADA